MFVWKELGSNHSAVESVFFSTERFSNSLIFFKNIQILLMFLVGFRGPGKNVIQSFIFSNVSTQIGVLISENLFL